MTVEFNLSNRLIKAHATLTATAPAEVVSLLALAKRAKDSAKFQLRLPKPANYVVIGFGTVDYHTQHQRTVDDWKRNRETNKALLDRSVEVIPQVEALIVKAVLEPGDFETVERLRQYLAVPAELELG